jgi:archaellum component FlaC
MGRRNDNTGVPQTCPFIDDVVSFVLGIEAEGNEAATEVLKVLEVIRTHNGNLRDFANQQYRRADEAEDEVRDLKREIDSLERDINALKD